MAVMACFVERPSLLNNESNSRGPRWRWGGRGGGGGGGGREVHGDLDGGGRGGGGLDADGLDFWAGSARPGRVFQHLVHGGEGGQHAQQVIQTLKQYE